MRSGRSALSVGLKDRGGFFGFRGGIEAAIARGRAYAPYADMIWCETSEPDLDDAQRFADAIRSEVPGKLLAYNCSPSFNWNAKLTTTEIVSFQRRLAEMGYQFQFVTLAGFHALNLSMFELAHSYRRMGMLAYSELQQREFEMAEKYDYSAVRHQRFVGPGYFDRIAATIASGNLSARATPGSTEEEQFENPYDHDAPETQPVKA